jgi:hypothetical protein
VKTRKAPTVPAARVRENRELDDSSHSVHGDGGAFVVRVNVHPTSVANSRGGVVEVAAQLSSLDTADPSIKFHR